MLLFEHTMWYVVFLLRTVSSEYVHNVWLSISSQDVTEARQQRVVLTQQNVQQFVHFLILRTLRLCTTDGSERCILSAIAKWTVQTRHLIIILSNCKQ